MKKILLAIALVFVMTLGAAAQTDGLFNDRSANDFGNREEESGFVMPSLHGTNYDFDSAPLGSGLLILTALGAGYALKKKRKKYKD